VEEIFSAVLPLISFGLLLAFYLQQRRGRTQAQRGGPIRARVTWGERQEERTRTSRWLVTTLYDVPGHGELVHHRRFEDEGPALLWSRTHREGSEHDVFPNLREPGTAFVAEDFSVTDPTMLILRLVLVVMGVLVLYGCYLLAAEYLYE